jgi:hypothetical protein
MRKVNIGDFLYIKDEGGLRVPINRGTVFPKDSKVKVFSILDEKFIGLYENCYNDAWHYSCFSFEKDGPILEISQVQHPQIMRVIKD